MKSSLLSDGFLMSGVTVAILKEDGTDADAREPLTTLHNSVSHISRQDLRTVVGMGSR